MLVHFLIALGLVLVIEGIIPFVNPRRWRRTILLLASQTDSFLRKMGLISMLVGLVIVYTIHHFIYN